MSKKQDMLTRSEHLSPSIGPCLLIHSGIHWTPNSQARGQPPLALMVTYEVMLVQAY